MPDSRKVSREYAVLVINSRKQRGQAVNALTGSLFHKINKILTATRRSLSVFPINPESSDYEQPASWVINVESTLSIKRLFIKEFFLPPVADLSTKTYLLWISRAPIRSAIYLWYKIREKWLEASSNSNKIWGILRIIPEAISVALETILFIYIIPLLTITVIRPLRRMSGIAFILLLLTLLIGGVLISWQQTFIPLITWTSDITHQVIEIANDNRLKFDILFPVIASAVLGVILAFTIILGRIAQWMFHKADYSQGPSLYTTAELSYLLNPLYATKLREDFEYQLIDLNNKPNIQRIFVIGEYTGALLAYEVLSLTCRKKISKPVFLLTTNLSLAGFAASPIRSLWLLVDSIYWKRFSEPTPRNLSWHHLTTYPRQEYTVKLASRPRSRMPQVKIHYEKNHWFKGINTVLIDRLITLLRLA